MNEDIEKLAKSPAVILAIGLVAFQAAQKTRRAHNPIERVAGPWRGKGSFGKHFGPQTRRR